MRRVLPALVLGAALAVASLGLRDPAAAGASLPSSAPPGAPAPLTTPAPATSAPRPAPAIDEAMRRLGDELDRLLNGYRYSRARWGVLVVSLEHGDTIFARNPDSLLAPASNMKLLTSAGALHTLGPDYRYRTYLVSQGHVENGMLNGDLVLYGTGDPGISDRFYPSRTHVFRELARDLRDRGISQVAGDLVADASLLGGPLRPPGWDPADLNDHFAPGISAVSYNENVVSFRLEPAARDGLPPIVHTLPANADLPVNNQAVTVSGRAYPRVRIERDAPLQPFQILGRIQRGGRDVWRQMTVPEPARFAASVFRAVLEEEGVTVLGDLQMVEDPSASVVTGPDLTVPTRRDRPRTRILAVHESPPLREYLAVVNKESNNLFAELLFRTTGRVARGDGTPRGAAAAVEETLRSLGVDVRGLTQLDGSGLSEDNRVRPATFVDLLRKEAASPRWEELWASLPEAGQSRELGRMYRTPAAGNLRAKTGTISEVSALSGVVASAQGERLAFSIMVNGTPSTYPAKAVENSIGARLAGFARSAPPPDPVRTARAEPEPAPDSTPPTRTADAGRTTQEADSAPAEPGAATGQEAAAVASARAADPEPEPEPAQPRTHEVASGENFTVIARRYGVALQALQRANPGISSRGLQPGDELTIPSPGDAPATLEHRVASGENLTVIARRYGVSLRALQDANPGVDSRSLQPGDVVTVPAAAGGGG